MTESRLAQETLRESEQLARGIIDTALDAFVQIDESGSILDWNSQAEKIFGWPREDALGKNFDRPDRAGSRPRPAQGRPGTLPALRTRTGSSAAAAKSRRGGATARNSRPS